MLDPGTQEAEAVATHVARLEALVANIERVVRGKGEVVRLAVVGLLAEGHVLLEDVPGTGKTTLARALARSVDADFRRVQFTSDLLPADVLGLGVPGPEPGRFVFRPGPIFGNIVLADELNRSTPRTQSALLEAMNERRVSIEGETRPLPRPFFVIATQNPLEFEGTHPLPESQLDRFLIALRLGYPARDVERDVLVSRLSGDPLERLEPVMSVEDLRAAIEAVKQVRVDPALLDYALDVAELSRSGGRFLLGASTRAVLGWVQAARALALLSGRDFCVPDDVKRLAVPVLAHRVVPAPGVGALEGGDAGPEEAVRELLERVPAPA